MKKFATWLEELEKADTISGLPPTSNQNTTKDYRGKSDPQLPPKADKPVDEDIVNAVTVLKTIHVRLRNIFAKLQQKATISRPDSNALQRELRSGMDGVKQGIDGVGRSLAILYPMATANNDGEWEL